MLYKVYEGMGEMLNLNFMLKKKDGNIRSYWAWQEEYVIWEIIYNKFADS